MKKIITLLGLSLLNPLISFADHGHKPLLDKVMFQLSAKQWVSTQSALLTANVNATLDNADLVKARAGIMDQLNKIAAGDWHITQFDRSQDSSGLDKLYVEAQVRVLQSKLTDIYKNAKSISKPGVTYAVSSIEFKPDLDDVQHAKAQLRDKLYQLVNEELARINKAYGEQHYSVNRLIVTDGEGAPLQTRARAMNTMSMAVKAAPAPMAPELTVSNELVMSAVVEVASNRPGGQNGVSSNH